jgi:hypothetical protein
MSPSMSEDLAYSSIKMAMPKRLVNAEDYFDWAFSMENVLSCKNANLWFIIEGSLTQPKDSLSEEDLEAVKIGTKFATKDLAEYHKTNAEARSTILNCLGPAQQALVRQEKEAKVVWNKLKNNYAQNIGQQVAALESQLATIAQGGDSIETYRFKIEKRCGRLEYVGSPVWNSKIKGIPARTRTPVRNVEV